MIVVEWIYVVVIDFIMCYGFNVFDIDKLVCEVYCF